MEKLKIRLYEYFRERQGDFDQVEFDNLFEVLDELNDDLTNMKKWDEVLILRLIDDADLYAEVDALYEEPNPFDNEFDEFGF